MQKKYKITVTIPDNKEYYYSIFLKELDRLAKDVHKLQGCKVEIKELKVHHK